MLKAKQQKLLHETNQILLTIRQFEIGYFTNLYSTFGMLGAIMSGFAVNSIAQVLAEEAGVFVMWKTGFWLSSCLCIAFSIHVMVTTALILVHGPGLALRGPLGSMKRAVDGMFHEQKIILLSTILSIVWFAVELLTIFVLEMFIEEAWVSGAILIGSSFYWYHSCIRIYNRFKIPDEIDHTDDDWRKSNDPALRAYGRDSNDSTDSSYIPPNVEKMRTAAQAIQRGDHPFAPVDSRTASHAAGGGGGNTSQSHSQSHSRGDSASVLSSVAGSRRQLQQQLAHQSSDPVLGSAPVASGPSVLKKMNSMFTSSSSVAGGTSAASANGGSGAAGASAPVTVHHHEAAVYKEGYLMLQAPSVGGWLLSKPTWERRYFVLTTRSLWYYLDKYSYERHSNKPLITRPLRMQHYQVEVAPHAIARAPYEFELLPDDEIVAASNSVTGNWGRKWLFRCDTVEEMKSWVEMLDAAIVAAKADAAVSELQRHVLNTTQSRRGRQQDDHQNSVDVQPREVSGLEL